MILGIWRETIIFLEQGKYNPSLRLAYNVAKVLNTTIEELFAFQDWAIWPTQYIISTIPSKILPKSIDQTV